MDKETAKTKKILDRLVLATGVASEAALSGPLGVSTQAIYDARKRNKVPDSWFRIVAERYEISADWLMFGRGLMRPGEAALDSSQQQASALEEQIKGLNKRVTELETENKNLLKETLSLYRRLDESRQAEPPNADIATDASASAINVHLSTFTSNE